MNLTWHKCQTGNHMATLPYIPGYPYGSSFTLAHVVTLVHPGWDTRNVKDVWTFEISLDLKSGGTAKLTNDDFHIPGTATMEELKQAVEQLTVEDIAAKFLEKGWQPVGELNQLS